MGDGGNGMVEGARLWRDGGNGNRKGMERMRWWGWRQWGNEKNRLAGALRGTG